MQDVPERPPEVPDAQPSAEEIIARARARVGTTGTRLDPEELLAARDADRR